MLSCCVWLLGLCCFRRSAVFYLKMTNTHKVTQRKGANRVTSNIKPHQTNIIYQQQARKPSNNRLTVHHNTLVLYDDSKDNCLPPRQSSLPPSQSSSPPLSSPIPTIHIRNSTVQNQCLGGVPIHLRLSKERPTNKRFTKRIRKSNATNSMQSIRRALRNCQKPRGDG